MGTTSIPSGWMRRRYISSWGPQRPRANLRRAGPFTWLVPLPPPSVIVVSPEALLQTPARTMPGSHVQFRSFPFQPRSPPVNNKQLPFPSPPGQLSSRIFRVELSLYSIAFLSLFWPLSSTAPGGRGAIIVLRSRQVVLRTIPRD